MRPLAIIACAALVTLLGACSQPDKPSVPLYLAMQRSDLDQIERHIYWGSDINAALPNGRYPLHIAAQKGDIAMVRILLKHGAATDQITAEGDTALDLAILSGRTQAAEFLLQRGAGLDASALLLKAAAMGTTDRDTVNFLVAHGANTEQVDSAGDTPLLIAIRQDNHRLATHLVNTGADVNVKTAEGQSALTLARDRQFPELISLLQRQGAR